MSPIATNAATAACALSAFALLGATAPAASAQSWELRFSEETLSPATPSTTVTLWASFPPTDWAVAGARLDLEASEPRWSDLSALLTGQPGQMPGEIEPDGRRVTDIRVGQLIGFGRTPDPSNPIAVWQATFTATDFSMCARFSSPRRPSDSLSSRPTPPPGSSRARPSISRPRSASSPRRRPSRCSASPWSSARAAAGPPRDRPLAAMLLPTDSGATSATAVPPRGSRA